MVDFKWFRNFRERFANRGADGFSLIEMVTIIPIVALTSGFIVVLISQGITASAESNAISNASVAVNAHVNEISSAINCYDLDQKATGEKIHEQPNKDNNIVTTTDFSKSKCVPGSAINIKVSAKNLKMKDPETKVPYILYSEDIQVFISE